MRYIADWPYRLTKRGSDPIIIGKYKEHQAPPTHLRNVRRVLSRGTAPAMMAQKALLRCVVGEGTTQGIDVCK